ncbi:MAG: FecR family protein [Deltaproteobacteria bacterium]|nr:FecR family protein [Deltaproteobacteria bacterium]
MNRDERDLDRLVKALQNREYADPGPARLEFERRRLLGRLSGEERARRTRVSVGVLAVAAAGAVALAAGVLVVLLAGNGRLPGTGSVSLSGSWRLAPGDAIASGTPVHIPDRSRAKLVMPDGTAVWLGSGARMKVDGGNGDRIRLFEGDMVVRAARRPQNRPLEIATPQTVVTVHGTTLAVAVQSGATMVRLHEGRVTMALATRSFALTAGNEARVTADGAATLREMDGVAAMSDLALAGERTWVAWLPRPKAGRGGALAMADSAAVPASPSPAEDRAAGAGDPQDTDFSAREHATARRAGPDLLEQVKERYRARDYASVMVLTASAAGTADLVYYRGRSLQNLGLFADASAAFLTLAGMDPGRKAEATYLAASALSHTRDLERSLALANEAAAAGGPNADHARALVFQMLAGMKRYGEAAREASDYLARHPNGAHVEEAVFYRALCRSRMDGPVAGRPLLEAYLSSFPSGRFADEARAELRR